MAIRYWFNVTEKNHVPHKFNEIIVLGLLARHSNRCVLKELQDRIRICTKKKNLAYLSLPICILCDFLEEFRFSLILAKFT